MQSDLSLAEIPDSANKKTTYCSMFETYPVWLWTVSELAHTAFYSGSLRTGELAVCVCTSTSETTVYLTIKQIYYMKQSSNVLLKYND